MRLLVPLLALVLGSASVYGSGSYKGKGRRPPNGLEATQYDLGEKVFTKKAELPESSAELATKQMEELEALSAALPARAQRRSNLVALAGRLSAGQLEALTYYVSVRYKVEVDK